MSATIHWKIKPFNELSLQRTISNTAIAFYCLCSGAKLRLSDMDGKDEKALHLIGEYDNKIVAYARLFKARIILKRLLSCYNSSSAIKNLVTI
jgi:ElaA protein